MIGYDQGARAGARANLLQRMALVTETKAYPQVHIRSVGDVDLARHTYQILFELVVVVVIPEALLDLPAEQGEKLSLRKYILNCESRMRRAGTLFTLSEGVLMRFCDWPRGDSDELMGEIGQLTPPNRLKMMTKGYPESVNQVLLA